MNQALITLRGDIERLRRHYELAVRTYDEIALADLSHTLRIWSEMKSNLAHDVPSLSGSIAFRAGSPNKRVSRLLRDHEFVLSYLPGGAITFASKGELVQLPETWATIPGTQYIEFRENEDDSVEMATFCAVREKLSLEQGNELRNYVQKRLGYQQWLDSEAVRVGMPSEKGDIEIKIVPRDVLIKRVANKYQGSHSRLAKDNRDGESTFDACVAYLMEIRWGGLPFPYFILLKAAQDILSIVGPKIAESA